MATTRERPVFLRDRASGQMVAVAPDEARRLLEADTHILLHVGPGGVIEATAAVTDQADPKYVRQAEAEREAAAEAKKLEAQIAELRDRARRVQ